MADAPPGQILSPEQAEKLLESVDGAFQDALHGRYGGGIEAVMLGETAQSAQTLRLPASGSGDRILLLLQTPGQTDFPLVGGGTIVGRVEMLDGSLGDVSIFAEVLDPRDANEACDASGLMSGILFTGPEDGALSVVRSTEAARQGDGQAARSQRGWSASQSRTAASRALGLPVNGHRRAPPSGLTVPVTAELLMRLGAAAASVMSGRLTLVVETSPASMR